MTLTKWFWVNFFKVCSYFWGWRSFWELEIFASSFKKKIWTIWVPNIQSFCHQGHQNFSPVQSMAFAYLMMNYNKHMSYCSLKITSCIILSFKTQKRFEWPHIIHFIDQHFYFDENIFFRISEKQNNFEIGFGDFRHLVTVLIWCQRVSHVKIRISSIFNLSETLILLDFEK